MEIYKKLLAARDFIKKTPLKKEGLNKFSGYEYFKPSQISELVHDACMDNGLICLYSLEKVNNELIAILGIFNIEKSEEHLKFSIPTAIPDIKATNEAQRIGGTITYSERYLKMIAFDISDNSLDFDTTENTEKQAKNVKKSEPKMPIIPKITENFFKKNNWDGTINELNQVNWGGQLWQLSELANKQLRDYIDSEIEKKMIAESQQKDLDGIDSFKD